MNSSILRLIVIGIIFLIGLFLQLKKRNTLFTIITIFILTLPFNITTQLDLLLPYYDPYVLNIKVNYLIPTLYWTDVLVVVLFSYLLFTKEFKQFIKNKYLIYAGILAVAYWVIHIFLHPEIVAILSLSRLYLYSITAFLFFSLYKPLKINKLLKQYKLWFLVILLISGAFQLFVGVFQMLSGTDLGLQLLGESNLVAGMVGSSFIADLGTVYLRAYGTFPHPNVFGAFFILCLVVVVKSLELMRTDDIKLMKYLLYFLGITSLFGILISFSRMAYLGAVLILAGSLTNYFYPELLKKKKGIKGKNFLAIPFIERLNIFGNSLSERAYLMALSWDIFMQNWLFGVGSGMFVSNYENIINRNDLLTGENGIILLQPVHNVFMLALTEHGLFGLSIFAIIIWLFFKSSKAKMQNKLQKLRFADNILSLFILLYLIIAVNVDHFMWTLPQGMVIGITIILLTISPSVNNNSRQK